MERPLRTVPNTSFSPQGLCPPSAHLAPAFQVTPPVWPVCCLLTILGLGGGVCASLSKSQGGGGAGLQHPNKGMPRWP